MKKLIINCRDDLSPITVIGLVAGIASRFIDSHGDRDRITVFFWRDRDDILGMAQGKDAKDSGSVHIMCTGNLP